MTTYNEENIQQNDDFLNIQDILILCLSKWKWFVLSLLIAGCCAVFYILRTPPVYTRSAAILIKEEGKGSSSLSSELSSFADMGIFSSSTNVYNELISIQSPAIMWEVVKRLHIDVNYQEDGLFHRNTLYGASLPVRATFLDTGDDCYGSFQLDLGKDGVATLSDFRLKDKKEDGPVKGHLGDTLGTPLGRVIIMPTEYSDAEEHTIYVSRSTVFSAARGCSAKFTASLNNKNATVIDMSYDDVSTKRAEDILNTIIAVYNENWVKDKNQIAVSTSMFINERLRVIEQELGNVDSDISSFKSEHLIPDIQAASDMYMQNANTASNQVLALNNQLYMAKYIRTFLQQSKDNGLQLLPANSGVESSAIEKQIGEFNDKLLLRNSLAANSSDQNPLVVDMDRALYAMSDAILKSLDNEINAIETKIRGFQESEKKSTDRIASNPTQAKYLISVERQQKVKEALYLFLLQKREENELSQAFTAYNTRIITPPTGSRIPNSPNRRMIMLVALVLGLAIPFGIIYLIQSLNTKVRGRKDLEKLSIPFIGEVPLCGAEDDIKNWKKHLKMHHEEKRQLIVVREGSRDIANEAFRVLRTNLEFMSGRDSEKNTFVFTSFNPGSGKSFLTVNLAISFAIKGKKILLIDGDLRHASSSAYANYPSKGIVDYLSRRIGDWKEVVFHSKEHSTFDVLPVGKIPPNPTELLEDKSLANLIAEARQMYDYVFIDCPPVDIVADTQIIESLADRTVFIVRAGLFERAMLPELESIYTQKKYKNMSLILNATESTGGRYGYRYGYKYGYRYGYGSSDYYGNSNEE
ncbi:MAG: GumC family protein [Candidatus Cryptobacteroides sp.]